MKPAEISIVTREGWKTRMIHSAFVLGDLEGNEANVELQVHERRVNDMWYLSVGLRYSDGDIWAIKNI
jgi:hypothetical protein